jgi:hypothetical protein
MTLDYTTMLRVCGQVFASAATAYADAATRFAGCALATGGALATRTGEAIQAPSDQRQAELEKALSTAYHGYVSVARVAAALPSRSTLVFLNELDRMRGPKMPPAPDLSF